VLFSGGQDSAVCLAWALERYDHVETVGFDYRQRHRVELICRQTFLLRMGVRFPEWSPRLKADHVLDLGVMSEIGASAMTADIEIQIDDNGLPNTFVPGRNLMFLTAAAALAYRLDVKNIIGGMCETDYSGYPDCRRETLDALERALNLGMESDVTLHTPLMQLTKEETWHLANELGGDRLIDLILEETHTCYLGDRDTRHRWGYGCGTCPACELRAKGYTAFEAKQKAAQTA
jgi:7-cyano-7-deazaguanine synthase